MTTPNPYRHADVDGSPLIGASAAIANAGGALTRSLATDPERWSLGDTVFLLVRADVVDVSFPAVPGQEDSRLRKHHLRATDATIVPHSLNSEVIDAIIEQMDRNRRAEEERAGTYRLPGV